jgi:hypothetical protein
LVVLVAVMIHYQIGHATGADFANAGNIVQGLTFVRFAAFHEETSVSGVFEWWFMMVRHGIGTASGVQRLPCGERGTCVSRHYYETHDE